MRESSLSPSAQKVQAALDALGRAYKVVELPQSTRSAAEAATAVGCQVGQIVKSLVFRGARSDRAILVIASGANRVDEAKLAALTGEPIANDALGRDALGLGPLGVAADRVGQAGQEVVADRAEAGGAGGRQVARPIDDGGVGVVHHERLPGLQAGTQQDALAVARLEHIEVEADVCAEEALAVEGRLARRLDADEDHRLHNTSLIDQLAKSNGSEG